MWRKHYIIWMILLAVGLAYAVDALQRPAIEPPAPVKQFSFQTMDGARHQLADYKNKTVLVNLWASWCGPCRAEMPELLKLAHDNPKTITLLLVSEDDNAALAQKFLAEFPAARAPNILPVWDGTQAIQRLFRTAAYPETAVISPDQTTTYKIIGPLLAEDIAAIKNNN